MLLGAPPLKITLPFANSGSKRVIPEASQIAITPGAASLTDGFPPLTEKAIASGGIAPDVKDFNGMLNELSAAVRWHAAGAGYVYDSTFASNTNVAGYPAGARVLRTDGNGYWVNTTDANTTNPESGGAGWLPDFVTGAASIAVSNTTVTLTSLQAGFPIIVLSGTITANLNVILPAYVKGWHIINLATGAFSVTVKTTAGTGVVLPSGSQAFVYGDGTNIVQLASNQVNLVLNTLTVSGASALNGGATTTTLTASGASSLQAITGTVETLSGAGTAAANTLGIVSVGNGLFAPAANAIGVSTAGVERQRIAADGSFSTVIPGGSTLYPDFGCRAWANFNGTNGAILGSGNISSVTRVSTGTYLPNLGTALPDINYVFSGSAGTQNGGTFASGDDNLICGGVSGQTGIKTTTSFRVYCKDSAGGSLEDSGSISLMVSR
jgi:hypothetical protein